MTSILLAPAFQKCFFQAGCRLKEEAQAWMSSFSHLFAARTKMRKNTSEEEKLDFQSATLRTQVHLRLIWQQSPFKRFPPSSNPSLPCATVFPLSILLLQLSVEMQCKPFWKKGMGLYCKSHFTVPKAVAFKERRVCSMAQGWVSKGVGSQELLSLEIRALPWLCIVIPALNT